MTRANIPQSDIHYQINLVDPKAHLFEVQLELTFPDAAGPILWLPNWLPGSYLIRDFAKHLINLVATNNAGAPVAIHQLDKNSWQVDPVTGPVTITYQVYAWDLSVRGGYLDEQRGFFNGSSLLLAVRGQEEQPCKLTLLPPQHSDLQQWQVATAMTPVTVDELGFGEYHAHNYDDLIDHPVELGEFSRIDFEANGIPHSLVLAGRHYADLSRIAEDLKQICEYQLNLFGGPAPFEQYLFLTAVVGSGFGGLEHRASTALLCSRHELPSVGETDISSDYRNFLSLCSHEYFHSWNIKKIKPQEFTPYQLGKETYTRQLWAYEGITSYYDELTLARCGVISHENYLTLLSQMISRVIRGSGRFKQTLLDSSFTAWTKFYQQDENAANAIVSYYSKGALFALGLDLHLRRVSKQQVSLDQVMQVLWQRFGQTAVGTTDDSVLEIGNELTGEDLTGFFTTYLSGTDDIPLADLLGDVGIDYQLRHRGSQKDLGGDTPAQLNKIQLGARYEAQSLGIKLTQVLCDGMAYLAGLSAGDRLVALDGLEITADNFEPRLQKFESGQSVLIHGFRRDEFFEKQLKIMEAQPDTVTLKIKDTVLSQTWLG